MIEFLIGISAGISLGLPLGFLVQRKRHFEEEFKAGFDTAIRFCEDFKISSTTFEDLYGPHQISKE